MVADFTFPDPVPAPVTTIAWRIGHLLVGVLGERNALYFGGEDVSYQTYRWTLSADEALTCLDAAIERWLAGVGGLGDDGLERRLGPSGGPFADFTYAELVLHIHREVIHHGAEIALLRDLYAHRTDTLLAGSG